MRQIGPGLREALQPLLRLARRLPRADQRAWLHELRNEAPAVADVLERILNEPDVTAPESDAHKPRR